MANLQTIDVDPFPIMSSKSTPLAIRHALEHICTDTGGGLWLVGGSALAGFYAEHRRSDDLDLFAIDPAAFTAAILAVHSLEKEGATLSNERRTPNYFHVDVVFKKHAFTIDIVLDERMHEISRASETKRGVWVARLPTLFAAKAACLISRCSEKDLFDLFWFFSKLGTIDVQELIERGSTIDGGLTTETLLISLEGAILRKDACHFLLTSSKMTVDNAYKNILKLRKDLIDAIMIYEKTLPPSRDARALSQSIRDQRKK